MLERLVENRIREAMAAGEFDDLPGRGRPIDLTLYFQLPAAQRVALRLLKDHHILPEKVQLLKEIGELRAQIAACHNEAQRRHLTRQLNYKQMAFSLA
jgi:hypothetical protein